MLFPKFQLEYVDVGEGSLRVRRGGSGPPLLLLHGNPQTHAMWHAVAPELASRFTVICPDLRGYGGSLKPEATADHALYAKRAMADDMVRLMQRLGHARFALAGHDRGARVAHRLALDHSEHVLKLAVLDIIPTIEHFERADMAFGLSYYHWFWFAQPHPFPEVIIDRRRARSSQIVGQRLGMEGKAPLGIAAGMRPKPCFRRGDDPRHVRGLSCSRQHRSAA
jgi:haloacetate dehalogenase